MNALNYLDNDLLDQDKKALADLIYTIEGIAKGIPYRTMAEKTGCSIGYITNLKFRYYPGLHEAESHERYVERRERDDVAEAKYYTTEKAKQDALAMIVQGGHTIREISRETGVSVGTVHSIKRSVT